MRTLSIGLGATLLAAAASAQPVDPAALRPPAEIGPRPAGAYQSVVPGLPKKPFRISAFERLPPDTREDSARKIVENAFPVGSAVSSFEAYFSNPKNKCVRAANPRPALTCYFHVPAFSLVSADWIIGAYTDEVGSRITEVFVSRGLTGM